jgi:hypothetical protein
MIDSVPEFPIKLHCIRSKRWAWHVPSKSIHLQSSEIVESNLYLKNLEHIAEEVTYNFFSIHVALSSENTE